MRYPLSQDVLNFDFYNGTKVYEALWGSPDYRSLLSDTNTKGTGAYATELLNTFSGDEYSQVLYCVDDFIQQKRK